jgi:hypothetical protein
MYSAGYYSHPYRDKRIQEIHDFYDNKNHQINVMNNIYSYINKLFSTFIADYWSNERFNMYYCGSFDNITKKFTHYGYNEVYKFEYICNWKISSSDNPNIFRICFVPDKNIIMCYDKCYEIPKNINLSNENAFNKLSNENAIELYKKLFEKFK